MLVEFNPVWKSFLKNKQFLRSVTNWNKNLLFKQNQYEEILIKETKLEFVKAGVGEVFNSTDKLELLNYKEILKTKDIEEWGKVIKIEHNKLRMYKLWEAVDKKQKSIDTYIDLEYEEETKWNNRVRLNLKDYKQVMTNTIG